MKRFLTVLLGLTGLVAAAFGQEEKPAFRTSFSLEIGAAPGPLHMRLPYVSPSWEALETLAESGQNAYSGETICLAVSLSGVFRTGYRWETVVTGSVSWSHCPVIQYEAFGVDPQGKPRYDLSKGTRIGWRAFSPVATLTIQERVFWNPLWKVQLYSGFGLGIPIVDVVPLPSLVPAGVRVGGGHFYGYAETGFTPFASFLHGGIGWKF